MSLTPAMIDALVAAGGTIEQLAAIVKADLAEREAHKASKRAGNAERQRRFKSRHRDEVTRDNADNALPCVTPSPSPLPSPQTPLPTPHPHPDNNTRARKGAGAPAKPDGVSGQIWGDFLDLRKRKRSPLTQTALDGIEREARQASWPLEAALAECVTRGWQAFKADWVKDAPKPNAPGKSKNPLVASILAERARANASGPP